VELQTIPIKSLRPFARNPRTHPDSAIAKLVKSIETYGWTNPVLVNKDMTVLAGHARLKAAQKLGMKDVPVIVLDIPDEYAAAYVIADNRIQDETSWDLPTLKDILQELDTGAFDMEATGFSEDEIEKMMTAVHEDAGKTMNEGLQYQIIVTCDSEAHQAQMLEELEGRGLKCQALIL